MNKRQAQKRETRKKIRESAKQLFNTQGFEATTSRQIAQQAGVASGTIFVHFPNKNAILIDILYEDIEEKVAEAFRTLPSSQGTVGQLIHIAEVLYRYYLEHPELSRILLQHSLLQPADDTEFTKQVEAFLKTLTNLVQQGQSRKDVTQTKDAEIVASIFMSAYFFVLIGLLREDSLDLAGALDQLEQMTYAIIT